MNWNKNKVKRGSRQMGEVFTFTANGKVSRKIPSNGYFSHANFLMRLNVTGGVAVTPNEDALARIIKAIRITAGGGSYLDVSDGRQLYHAANFDYQGRLRMDSLPAAGVTANVYILLPYHPGVFPNDLFDRTSNIPMGRPSLANVNLEFSFGDATDLGTGYTINNGEVTVSYNECTLVNAIAEDDPELWENGIPTTSYAAVADFPITAAISNLGLLAELPIGKNVLETTIIVLNSAENRSNAEVMEIGFTYTKSNETPLKYNFRDLNAECQLEYGLALPVTGVVKIRWEKVTGDPFGLSTSGAGRGDHVIGFTTSAAGGNILMFHKCII